MNKKLIIFIIVLLIMVGATLSILIYLKISKPFLDIYLKEESFQGIVDKNNVMFTKEGGNIEDGSCKVYLKNINNSEETFLANLEDCHRVGVLDLYLSKDKKHISFKNGNSIFDYDIDNRKSSLIYKIEENFERDSETRLNLIGFSPKENKILFDKVIYETDSSMGDEGWKNTTQKVEIYVYDTTTKNLSKRYENVFIAKFVTDSSTGSWDEGWTYASGWTRWTPDGEAIIFETELGGLPKKQYIFYLDDLDVKELSPKNVRGNINTCGYWYNKGEREPEFIEGYSFYVFRTLLFPDGKTFLKRESIYQKGCFMDCSPIRFKYYIKESESSYCIPL
jgi:hypothetical protein